MAEIEPGVHLKQEVPTVDLNKLDAETKAEFLKRRAAEDRAKKKNNKILEEWYCLGPGGDKLLKRVLKANGSVYSFFMFRVKKNKDIFNKHYKPQLKDYSYDPVSNYIEEIKKAKRK